jgi:hypothetical protein
MQRRSSQSAGRSARGLIHPAIGEISMATGTIDPTPRAALWAAVAGLSLVLLACTTMGAGSGSLSPGNSPVAFTWTSKDGGNTGTMSATLEDGTTFNGPFLQVTQNLRADSFEPMWRGWRRGWGDWGPRADWLSATNYSGKVVANLQSADNQRLRCRFDLNRPVDGMAGGGQGECQFGGGRTVDAVFQRS